MESVNNINQNLQAQIGMPQNGIIKVYNQFPYCYPGGLDEMIQQLPHIKAMGFNAVWINPLHKTGRKQVKRGCGYVSGSLYAMFSEKEFNPRFKVTEEKLREYTQTARNLGLSPLFDLVLNQIAIDNNSPLVNAYKNLLISKPTFDDCLWFDYSNENKINYIVQNLWQPFIEKYVVEYGFVGVRVDAVKHLNRNVQIKIYEILNEVCQRHHKIVPIIMGELLNRAPTKYIETLQGTGLTHINNSLYDTQFNSATRANGNWDNLSNTQHVMGSVRKITFFSAEKKNHHGGTVGYVGNHDLKSLAVNILTDGENKLTEEQRLKQSIACIALTSDAGWYLLCGDEYGIKRDHSARPGRQDVQHICVFDHHIEKSDYLNKWEGTYDLSSFITAINWVLDKMPPSQLMFWVEHGIIENLSQIAVIIRHPTEGYTQSPSIIFVNLTSATLDLNPSQLVHKMFPEKLKANLSQSPQFYVINNNVAAHYNKNYKLLEQWPSDAPPLSDINHHEHSSNEVGKDSAENSNNLPVYN